MNILVLALILLSLVSNVPAEAVFNVHPDGSATVIVSMETIDRLYVSLRLEGVELESIVAFDDEGSPLPVDVNGSLITVYTLNASRASLMFNIELAVQEGAVWEVSLETNIPIIIVLPEGSGISKISSGGELDLTDNRLAVRFEAPGLHTVQYIYLPEVETASTTSSIESTPTTPQKTTTRQAPTMITISDILSALIVLAVGVGFLTLYFKRKRRERREVEISSEILDERDKEILEALDRYGKLTLSELSRIAGLHKSTVWRRVRKLRELGYVDVKNVSGRTVVEKIVKKGLD